MIGINKPLELEDGTPVRFKALYGDEIAVWVDGITRYFNQKGKHMNRDMPDLRNVQQERKGKNPTAIELHPIGTHKIVRTGVYGKPKSRIRIALEEIEVGQEFFHVPASVGSLKVMACKIGKERGIRISVRECCDGFVIQAYKKDKK